MVAMVNLVYMVDIFITHVYYIFILDRKQHLLFLFLWPESVVILSTGNMFRYVTVVVRHFKYWVRCLQVVDSWYSVISILSTI